VSDLHDQLRARYPADRYALFFEVPDAVSLDARRRIDAVAVGVWKSVGRNISGFEFKASRSDWLREVKQVNKADPFIAVCDYFYLVTTDASIAKIEEVPACWGWLSCTPNGLRTQRPATKLPQDKETLPWAFTVGLLRKLQDSLMDSADVRTRINAIHAEARADVDRRVDLAIQRLREGKELETLRNRVKQFEDAAGVQIDNWQAGDVGKIVKSLLDLNYGDQQHGAGFVTAGLERQAEEAERLAKVARETVARMRIEQRRKIA